MHIGLIGGIGPAATEFYYRGLVQNHPATAAALELTIAHADMSVMRHNLADDSKTQQAEIFRAHLDQLAAAGAAVAAVTSIAGHFCFAELTAISPLPLISALSAVADEINERGIRKLGLLGSAVAMQTGLYGALQDLELAVPKGDDLNRVGEEYFAMAAAQHATETQRELFFKMGGRLCRDQGAEVVVLAGTDLFLAFDGQDPGFPVIDSAEVHIAALGQIARSAP